MRLRSGSGDLTILAVAGAAMVILTAVTVLIAPVDTARSVDGSSFSFHSAGARGAFLALQSGGYDAQSSYEPLASLRVAPERTALIIAEPLLGPSRLDLRALQTFIEAGGRVLVTGAIGTRFLPQGPPWPARIDDQGATVVRAAIPSPLSARVPEVVMAPAPFALPADSPYVLIYGTEARPAVLAARFGSGRLMWWAGSTPLTNSGISAPGHVELLVNALGAPDNLLVLWDEHYHGHTRSLWSYVAQTPIPFAGLQLLFVAALGMLAFSRRRWPVRALYEEPRSSPIEFVDSMGALYQRAKTAAGAVRTVRARVRRLLCAKCGVPLSVSDEQLSRAAAGRSSMPQAELLETFEQSARAAADAHLDSVDARRAIVKLQTVVRCMNREIR